MWHFGSVQLFLLRPFLPVVCQNKELAAQHPGSIIVCTHQSFLDLYLFAAQSERNLCFVTKSWPFTKLFFFAPAMRAAGYLDAEALAPEALMQACSARLQEGSTLVFFPEGSRSRNGELGRFHAGAFLVAVREDTAVIPMIIHDSFQIFPPHARFCVPGTIHMELLSPVYPGAFRASDLPHRAMMKEVHRQIKQRRDLFTTGGSL